MGRVVHVEKSVSVILEAFGRHLRAHSSLTHVSVSVGPKTWTDKVAFRTGVKK